MEQIELRVLDSQLTVNEEDMIVEGLVNKTEAWSHTLGQRKKFREKIKKGAFSKAIDDAQRIDFLGEHRVDMLLATTENGSLELWEDDEGLKMRAKIAPTSYGKDLFTLMKEKMVNHMSFGFKAISDSWKKLSDGTFERSIDGLVLKEVSVVRNPAYPQSAISARNIEIVEDVEIPADIDVEERAEEPAAEVQPETIAEQVANTVNQSEIIAKMFTQFKTELLSELKAQQTAQPAHVVEAPAKSTEKVEVVVEPVVEQKEEPVVPQTEPVKTEEAVQTITEPEEKPVDNSKGVVDLLAKYKELQNFK